jgi:RimJ/RimL family protein N-acetyltransferase
MGVGIARTLLYRMDKSDVPRVAPAAADVAWELLTVSQLTRLSELGPFDLRAGAERLERGDECHAVFFGGRLAHYSWVQRSGTHRIEEAGISVPVEKGAFWIYHCATGEWARGRKIYPATLQRIVAAHHAAGYDPGWIYTLSTNQASQRGIVRAGFTLWEVLTALRLGPYYRHLGRRRHGQ